MSSSNGWCWRESGLDDEGKPVFDVEGEYGDLKDEWHPTVDVDCDYADLEDEGKPVDDVEDKEQDWEGDQEELVDPEKWNSLVKLQKINMDNNYFQSRINLFLTMYIQMYVFVYVCIPQVKVKECYIDHKEHTICCMVFGSDS